MQQEPGIIIHNQDLKPGTNLPGTFLFTGTIENLEKAIEKDNRHEARNILHGLRGSAANASIFEVLAAAEKLHEAVKENKGKEELKRLMGPLECALNKALKGINSIPG